MNTWHCVKFAASSNHSFYLEFLIKVWKCNSDLLLYCIMKLCVQTSHKNCSILNGSTKTWKKNWKRDTPITIRVWFLLTLACVHHPPLLVVLSTLKTCSALQAFPLPGPPSAPIFVISCPVYCSTGVTEIETLMLNITGYLRQNY